MKDILSFSPFKQQICAHYGLSVNWSTWEIIRWFGRDVSKVFFDGQYIIYADIFSWHFRTM